MQVIVSSKKSSTASAPVASTSVSETLNYTPDIFRFLIPDADASKFPNAITSGAELFDIVKSKGGNKVKTDAVPGRNGIVLEKSDVSRPICVTQFAFMTGCLPRFLLLSGVLTIDPAKISAGSRLLILPDQLADFPTSKE